MAESGKTSVGPLDWKAGSVALAIGRTGALADATCGRAMTPLNEVIGSGVLGAWQPVRGVTWVQTRSPQFARKLSQRRDSRLVARGVAGGYQALACSQPLPECASPADCPVARPRSERGGAADKPWTWLRSRTGRGPGLVTE